jgi:quaternary ammonium compound-resistance protein SugE
MPVFETGSFNHSDTRPQLPEPCGPESCKMAGLTHLDQGRTSGMAASTAWGLLIVAGVLEVVWAIGLKYTEGFTRLWPSVGTIAAMVVSMGLLGIAVRHLPVGTGYAVWVGIGAVGTAILGIVLLGESASVARLASIGLIVTGIICLKLTTPG